MTPPRIAVVDGFSVANHFVTGLRAGGASLAHVLSSPDLPPFFTRSFRPENYDLDLGYDADLVRLTDELARWGVDRVVPGSESGVLLADALGARLGTPGNQPANAAARRDKALMGEVVAAAGLATPRGKEFDNAAEAVAWYTAGGGGSAVVKPLNSAGTDNVWFCADADAVEAACRRILGSSTVYGEPNRRFLVQEEIRGTEYYVNSVSHDGVHRAAEIWRYSKRTGPIGSPIYDFEETVPADGPEAAVLREFTFAVLDALGITSSAAHTEVMLTEKGPVLIETGARLGGATSPLIVERYSGVSQAGLYAATLLDPARLTTFDDAKVEWSATVRLVSLINRVSGRIASLDWVSQLEELPTAVTVAVSAVAGGRLDRTTILANSPGYLFLVSEDPAAVERDYATIRALEESGLYTN